MQAYRPTHHPSPAQRQAGISIGGILAIVALIAVIVIGYMLIRDGGTTDVQAEAEEQTTELQEGFDAAEARTRLTTLRSDIEAGLDEEALRERYDDIRSDLEAGYADASGDAAAAWENLSPRLDELGDQIGQASEDAVATIDAMLNDFPEE